MITLAIPTLRRYDLLVNAVTSACAGSLPPKRVLIIDNGIGIPNRTLFALNESTHRVGAKLDIQHQGSNIGVAAAWNIALTQCDDHLIMSNDDVTFYTDTIDRLITAATNNPNGLFFFPGGGGYKNAWSLFLQRKASVAKIGLYDESISPQYGFYEDNDYSYRLMLAGYEHIPVGGCGYGHFDSATVKSFSPDEVHTHWQRFEASQQRYIAKWGGLPGKETYTQPYKRPHTGGANAPPVETMTYERT